MIKLTETTSRTVYKLTEAEFKQALGITDPEPVLNVSVSAVEGMVYVYLCQPEP